MSTQSAISVESTRNLAAATDEAGASAESRRPESDRVVRVSLYGCFIEIEENAGTLPRSFLGC